MSEMTEDQVLEDQDEQAEQIFQMVLEQCDDPFLLWIKLTRHFLENGGEDEDLHEWFLELVRNHAARAKENAK